MSFAEEFRTVDIIVASGAETRGVDAFALSLIKAERQMRKLVTFLVFQYACFTSRDIPELRETLGENRRVYFEGFERGFDTIYKLSISSLVGSGYPRLRLRIDDAIACRNKIFHGQLTTQYLDRANLLKFVDDIRYWCQAVSTSTEEEIGYDGFARESFQKSNKCDLAKNFKVQIDSIDGYRNFIVSNMQRR